MSRKSMRTEKWKKPRGSIGRLSRASSVALEHTRAYATLLVQLPILVSDFFSLASLKSKSSTACLMFLASCNVSPTSTATKSIYRRSLPMYSL